MKIQIDRIFYPVKTLGYGKRLGIWTIGCPRHCKNCSNPELQIPQPDKTVSVEFIVAKIEQLRDKIDGITITGGDPFYQPEPLKELLTKIRSLGIEDILIYTGYTFEDIQKDYILNQLLPYIGVLIDGPYIDKLNDNMSIRGSSNQNIYILKNSLSERYRNVDNWKRESQLILSDNRLYAIGIPHQS